MTSNDDEREPQAGTRARPRVVAVVNLKGGTGKTATAAFLVDAWAGAGERVTFVDADHPPVRTEQVGGTCRLGPHLLTDTSGIPFVLVQACLGRTDTDAQRFAEQFVPYLRAEKMQAIATRAAMLVDDSPGTHLVDLAFENSVYTAEDAREADQVGLFGLDVRPSRPVKAARSR